MAKNPAIGKESGGIAIQRGVREKVHGGGTGIRRVGSGMGRVGNGENGAGCKTVRKDKARRSSCAARKDKHRGNVTCPREPTHGGTRGSVHQPIQVHNRGWHITEREATSTDKVYAFVNGRRRLLEPSRSWWVERGDGREGQRCR